MVLLVLLTAVCICSRRQTSSEESHAKLMNRTEKPILPHVVIIGLKKRHQDFVRPLMDRLSNRGWNDVEWFQAIDKSIIQYTDYPLTQKYKEFFEKKQADLLAGKSVSNYIGHLACTLSHLQVIRNIVNQPESNMTLILEDDVDVLDDLFNRFSEVVMALNELDPEWQVLCLGFACGYNHHQFCQLNDQEPIYKPGLVKLHYWFGGWSYVIRSPAVAQAILKGFEPEIPWHIDLTLADMARQGQLKVYGCIPVLVAHPGSLRISSFDFTQLGDTTKLRSDTNS